VRQIEVEKRPRGRHRSFPNRARRNLRYALNQAALVASFKHKDFISYFTEDAYRTGEGERDWHEDEGSSRETLDHCLDGLMKNI